MTVADIKAKAAELGVKVTKSAKKSDVIRAIQAAEGYDACFGTRSECPHQQCCFRDDCVNR